MIIFSCVIVINVVYNEYSLNLQCAILVIVSSELCVKKSFSLFALHKPLLQSLGLQHRACTLAGTVEQTGRYNFDMLGK